MADRILILGASVRAAAASARRAGLVPFGVDLFADADTERICGRVWKCPPDRYPHGLFELAKHAPPMPWMYTGGLENYPELVGGLSRERELWGNGPDVLRRVRDPHALSAVLSGKGFYHARPWAADAVPTPSHRWVRKPLAGSGGGGIRFAYDPAAPVAGTFCQEYVPGRPMSTVYSSRHPRCDLLASTTQLVGTSWLHASGFRYAGSVGPAVRSWDVAGQLPLLGYRLLIATGITGVWGVDFVRTGGDAFVVELNPRYTASVEVIEHATGLAALTAGLEGSTRPTNATKTVGKAIYYAPHRLTVPASGPWDDSLTHAADVWHRPDFADIPHPGDVIDAGQPVITIMTDADTEAACIERLQARAAELDRLFGYPPPTGDAA